MNSKQIVIMNKQYKNRTPLLLRILLFITLPYDDLTNLSGDFEELYCYKRTSNGKINAFTWLIWQIIISAPGFIFNKIYWGAVMFKNYLLATFRNIKSQKGYSFINITGLAIGFTCSMLILIYIQYELSYDKHFDSASNIYRVCSETSFSFHGKNKGTATPAPLAKELLSQMPEIVHATTFDCTDNILIQHGENKFFENNFFFAAPSIINVFSFPLVEGYAETALSDPTSILLSETMAAKYFGKNNPIGETIVIDGKFDFIVTGVLMDIPDNTHFTINFVVPLKALETLYGDDLSAWYNFGFLTYFRIRDNVNINSLEKKIQNLSSLSAAPGQEPVFKYFVQPLTDIHLYSDYNGELDVNNYIGTIYLFGLIAILILLIAGINYINLSTSRSFYRAKEIGIRKVIGAQKSQIIKQFLSESIILTFFAVIISITLTAGILPYFNLLVERELNLEHLFNISFLIPLFAFVVLIGIGAGFYPSLVMASFKPVSVLSGNSNNPSKSGKVRNIFVVTQFSISIILIISTISVNEQLSFIKNKDVGYSKEQIVTVMIRDRSLNEKMNAVRAELLSNSNIENVSFSAYLPNSIGSLSKIYRTNDLNSETFAFYRGQIDFNFVDLYNIKLIDGRNLSEAFPSDSVDGYLVNETAVKTLALESPVGKDFYYGMHGGNFGKARIIGVIKDFNMHSLHQKIEPLYCGLGTPNNYRYLSVKLIAGDIPGTLNFIESVFEKHSKVFPFEYNFFDEIFNRVYKKEQREELILSLFAMLAVFIACLGLFGLISFIAIRRTKEIGIRKVLGASISTILIMLMKDFIKLVLISNIIAIPIAYYIMNNWLNNFAYRIELGVSIFVFSGLIALIVAGITIIYQAARAALVNPIDSLRYE